MRKTAAAFESPRVSGMVPENEFVNADHQLIGHRDGQRRQLQMTVRQIHKLPARCSVHSLSVVLPVEYLKERISRTIKLSIKVI